MNRRNFIQNVAEFFGCKEQSIPTSNLQLPENAHCRDAVLIIDASGSMFETDWKPSRLRAAQEAGHAYIRRLCSEESNARVAVVAYGSNAKLVVGLTCVRKHGELILCINSIKGLGCTNITAGLSIAFRLLKANQRNGQAILLTDGGHNVGSAPNHIAKDLKKCAVIECVGIGGSPADVDEGLLRQIASSYPDGSKRYRWIGDKERLVEHFHNLAGRLVRQ